MHRFIILADDIYTLDTSEERDLAAEHMRDAKVDRLKVYVGGPTNYDEDGRAFFADGTLAYWVEHSLTGCYGGQSGLVS